MSTESGPTQSCESREQREDIDHIILETYIVRNYYINYYISTIRIRYHMNK